jgi:hypothetical protein
MQTRTLMTVENFNRNWKDKSIAEVRKAIGWSQDFAERS